MNENIITWNVTNWVTIVLMAALGFMIIAVLTSVARGKMGMAAPAPSGDSLPVGG